MIVASLLLLATTVAHAQGHWQIAVKMLNHALDQPTYLKTATISLQTALVLEGVLASPLAVGGD